MKKRKLFVFSAPSGAGKSTIVKHLLTQNLNLEFSISGCSRKKRKGEINGKHYYFLSLDNFKNKIKNDEFLEWEEVYKDNFYGTLKSEVERIWNDGKNVIFDIDVIGGLNLKKQFPNECITVYVQPPSLDELKNRLLKRDTETKEKIQMRIQKAKTEMAYAKKFDYILVNDNLEQAKKEAFKMIKNEL